ncbi:MAG TPA: glycosyltransferase family 4 protein [Solirubrobacteraceae bacterium]|jgi:glycosyltransferase involved in cell wall biosynthesis|nr:glycosyltransferase family 4 protein [Solirubrobacteraceae bacterium]
MVLFLHNRYRTTGGEERTVEDLLWLVREHLGEPAELLERRSSPGAPLGVARPGAMRGSAERARAAVGLLRGGLEPGEVAAAVRASSARVVHAHNLLPAFGWRALAAAREAGARVVLHLHQYRLVCAIGVCYTHGADCTRCHGRDTRAGVRLNCRGSRAEALAYGASLAMWQRRLVEQADAVIVPSVFARERLRELGAPLPWERVHVLAPPLRMLAVADGPVAAVPGAVASPAVEPGTSVAGARAGELSPGRYALVVSRLSPEKGVDVAIDACRLAGMELVVAGDGPERAALEARAGGHPVRFVGRVDDEQLTRLRAGAALALAPSRSGESFGLAAAEAMASGLAVVGSRVGALAELVDEDALVVPGDEHALAQAIGRFAGDREAGERGRARVRELCAPHAVARALAAVYST